MTARSTREGTSTESYIEREEDYENAEEAELDNTNQQYEDCDKASTKMSHQRINLLQATTSAQYRK